MTGGPYMGLPKDPLPTAKDHYRISLRFPNEGTSQYVVFVPHGTPKSEIRDAFMKEHANLDRKNADEDRYGLLGRCPDVLVHYVCGKYDWEYKETLADIHIELT